MLETARDPIALHGVGVRRRPAGRPRPRSAAQQLAQQQRVAAGGAVAGSDEGVVGVLAEPSAHQLGSRRRPPAAAGDCDGVELVRTARRAAPRRRAARRCAASRRRGPAGPRAGAAGRPGTAASRCRTTAGRRRRAPAAARAARLTVSQYSPCSAANEPSARLCRVDLARPRRTPTRPRRPSRAAARPGGPRSLSIASNSWRTAPNPNSRSSWLPRAVSTRAPCSAASRRASLQQPALADAGRAVDEGEPALAVEGVGQRSRAARAARRPGRRCRSATAGGCSTGWVGRAGAGAAGSAAGRAGVQRRRLRQHLGLQRPQRRAGVDAELVGQRGAGPAQRRQRVGLPVRPVERQHQQPPALLAQRVVGDEALESRGRARADSPCASRRIQQLLAGHLAQPGRAGSPRRRPTARPAWSAYAGPRHRPSASSSSRCAVAGSADPARAEQSLEPPGVDGVVRRPCRA